jgi:threonine aldolase
VKLTAIPGILVMTPCPETNMVVFEIVDAKLSHAQFLEQMLAAGVRMGQVRGQIRAVTHLYVSTEDIDLAFRAAADSMRSSRRVSSGSLNQVRRLATERCWDRAHNTE